MKKLLVVLFSLAFCFALGCDSGDDDDGGTVKAGTVELGSDEAEVSTLGADDVAAVCDKYEEAGAEVALKLGCGILGSFALMEGSKEDCEAAVDACMAGAEEGESECLINEDKLADCTATIGEIEACMNATLKVTEEAANAVSCALPTDLTTGGGEGGEAQTIASCDTVKEKCPDLMTEQQ